MAAGGWWSREETKMAFYLYCNLRVDEIDKRDKVDVLARALGRTHRSVSMKLWNIASRDKGRIALGKKGLKNASSIIDEIWEEFEYRGCYLIDECAKLYLLATEPSICTSVTGEFDLIPEGKTRVAAVALRANQQYFRNTLLSNYQGRCCITGLGIAELLIASHIKPWAQSNPQRERLAADNGLLLNAFHDCAFDQGLMTLDAEYRLVFSPQLKRTNSASDWLLSFNGRRIELPLKKPPAREFIEYHNDVIFLH